MTETRIGFDQLCGLAGEAVANGTEAEVVPLLDSAAREARTNARLWQWAGLLHRGLDEHERALEAFAAAARLAPEDASIAHGHARVALEAGLDARALFEQALRTGPTGDVILGHTAARYAMGEGREAAIELAETLDRNPLWVQGHVQWAQLSSMIGDPGSATATIDRALSQHPEELGLWHAAIHILTSADRHAEAAEKADAATESSGNWADFALERAAALSDSGQLDHAAAVFAALGEPRSIDHAVHVARYLIRASNWRELDRLTDRWMTGDAAHYFWPYASICWRHAADARWQWLEGDERLIQVRDLTPELPLIDELAQKLRRLHSSSGRFLDQSVRGGTQTDGPLLSRIDPEIRALRAAIVGAVDAYRAQLPPVDSRHPMLRHRRDRPVRFAGSWSVRLDHAGFHSHHIHPQGWISSAFYVAVPDGLAGNDGWLTLGEPQAELGVSMPPIRQVAPKPGQLVLFPSMMWHGTLPFAEGERMTVAFDVAPPR